MSEAYKDYWPLLKQVLSDYIDIKALSYSKHANERMKERKVSERVVEAILLCELPSEDYKPYEYPYGEIKYSNPDPVYTVVGRDEIGIIAIGLAVKRDRFGIKFTVVTVVRVEKGRHKNKI